MAKSITPEALPDLITRLRRAMQRGYQVGKFAQHAKYLAEKEGVEPPTTVAGLLDLAEQATSNPKTTTKKAKPSTKKLSKTEEPSVKKVVEFEAKVKPVAKAEPVKEIKEEPPKAEESKAEESKVEPKADKPKAKASKSEPIPEEPVKSKKSKKSN